MAEPFAFELAAALPFAADGLPEVVMPFVGGMAPPPGVEPTMRRAPSVVIRAPDGALWFPAGDRRAMVWRAGSVHAFSLAAADAGRLVALAPTSRGGAVVLGIADGPLNVLSALDAGGARIWRRTGAATPARLDLPSLTGEFQQLLTDSDGSVYLPGTRITGVIGRMDLGSGAVAPALRIGDERIDHPLLAFGKFFVTRYQEDTFRWAAIDLATARETSVPAPLLGERLTRPLAALPDGGAVVQSGADLVFLDARGGAASRLALAGLVRDGDGVVAAVRDGAALAVTHARGGHAVRALRLDGLPEGARLVHADAGGYWCASAPSLKRPSQAFSFDARGQRRPDQDFANDPKRLLALEGSFDILRPVVEPDGAVLLPGADAAGAYVVRVRPLAP